MEDPNYAPAYVGLADCFNLLREYSSMAPAEAYPRALAAAQRAIALDDSLSGAHSALAFAEFHWSWNLPEAEKEFRRAIALSPNSVQAHHWYATSLLSLARLPESVAEINQAQCLDPQSSAILADKALILYYADQKNEAMRLLRSLETSEPAFLSPHQYISGIALFEGDDATYLAEGRQVAELRHDPGPIIGDRGGGAWASLRGTSWNALCKLSGGNETAPEPEDVSVFPRGDQWTAWREPGSNELPRGKFRES